MNIAQIDLELARLQAEIASVERAPPSYDEAWGAVEGELSEAEAVFRKLGAQLSHRAVAVLPEYLFQQRQIAIGAALVANKQAIFASEKARIKAQTEGGLSAAERQRRLDQLRAAILRAAATRELLVRATEVEGEFLPRPALHAELAVFARVELERLARQAGQVDFSTRSSLASVPGSQLATLLLSTAGPIPSISRIAQTSRLLDTHEPLPPIRPFHRLWITGL